MCPAPQRFLTSEMALCFLSFPKLYKVKFREFSIREKVPGGSHSCDQAEPEEQ